MADHTSAATFDRWLHEDWTEAERAVIVAAEALARQGNTHRPWWRRRRVSPMEFVPAARVVVQDLMVRGWRPPESGSEAPHA